MHAARAPQTTPAPRRHPHHYPQPDEQGVAAVSAWYWAECGRELTDAEARRLLSRVMHYLWALNLAPTSRSAIREPLTPAPPPSAAIRGHTTTLNQVEQNQP